MEHDSNLRLKKSRGSESTFELSYFSSECQMGLMTGQQDPVEAPLQSHPWITSNNNSSRHPFSVTRFCLNGKCWGGKYHSFTVHPKQSSYYNWWPKATQTQDSPFTTDSLGQKLFNHLSYVPALLDQDQKTGSYWPFFYFIMMLLWSYMCGCLVMECISEANVNRSQTLKNQEKMALLHRTLLILKQDL